MRYALTSIALALLPLPARADALPAIVQTAVAEAKASCGTDPTRIEAGFLERIDVNGDGIPDYVLSYEVVSCAEGGRIACGTAGCLTQVLASTPSGYSKILDENVQGVRFRVLKGRPAMILGLHGSSCSKKDFEPCGATLYWNSAKFSPAH